jgi:cytochrome c553
MKTFIITMMLAFSFSAIAADGAKIFKKCISCHGKKGMGKKSQKAPMIAGQYAWYLESQIKAIRDKVRKNKNAKKMYPFVKKLSDADIAAVAKYISGMEVQLNVKK